MAWPVMSDTESDHAISCGWRDERFSKHNAVRDVLFITSQQAALAPVGTEFLYQAQRRGQQISLAPLDRRQRHCS